jgi:hypothetical protein
VRRGILRCAPGCGGPAIWPISSSTHRRESWHRCLSTAAEKWTAAAVMSWTLPQRATGRGGAWSSPGGEAGLAAVAQAVALDSFRRGCSRSWRGAGAGPPERWRERDRGRSRPTGRSLVGVQNDRLLGLVALVDDLKEEGGVGLPEGQVSEFPEDEEPRARQDAQQRVEAGLVALGAGAGDQVGGLPTPARSGVGSFAPSKTSMASPWFHAALSPVNSRSSRLRRYAT